MEVRGGEVVGIAGVSGNGQRELAEAIAGLRKIASGTVALDAVDVTSAMPAANAPQAWPTFPKNACETVPSARSAWPKT